MKKLALPLFGNIVQSVVWGVLLGVLYPSYASLNGFSEDYGVVVAVNAAAIAAFAIPGGRLSDIFGRRRLIFAGWAVMASSPIFLLGSSAFLPLVISAAIHGVGIGISQSAFSSYIADISKKKRLSSNYGVLSAVSLAIAAFATYLMGQWVETAQSPAVGIDMGFLSIGVLMALGAVSALGFMKMDMGGNGVRGKMKLRFDMSIFNPTEKKVVLDWVIMQAVTGIGAALTVQFYSLFFIEKFQIDHVALFNLSAVGTGVLALSTYISGEMGGRTNKLLFILASNIMAIPMAVGIITSPDFFFAGGFYVMRMALANMVWPVWSAFFMENLRMEVRGVASGMGFTLWNLTYIPSAFIGWGVLRWTGGWTIPLAAVMYAMVTAYVAWHLGYLEKRPKPQST